MSLKIYYLNYGHKFVLLSIDSKHFLKLGGKVWQHSYYCYLFGKGIEQYKFILTESSVDMMLAYTWAKGLGFQPYTFKKSPETFQIFMGF